MRDPHAAVSQVRQGVAPTGWRVFTKKRGAVSAFFRGTAHDPDPVLVFTTEAAIEYVSDKKPLAAVFFADLANVTLRARATTHSDSMIAHLWVWLDLQYADGGKVKRQSATFPNDLQVIQQFLEAYGAYKALSRRQ